MPLLMAAREMMTMSSSSRTFSMSKFMPLSRKITPRNLLMISREPLKSPSTTLSMIVFCMLDQGGEQVPFLLAGILEVIGDGELLDALLPPLGNVLQVVHPVRARQVEEQVRVPAQGLGGHHAEVQPRSCPQGELIPRRRTRAITSSRMSGSICGKIENPLIRPAERRRSRDRGTANVTRPNGQREM